MAAWDPETGHSVGVVVFSFEVDGDEEDDADDGYAGVGEEEGARVPLFG